MGLQANPRGLIGLPARQSGAISWTIAILGIGFLLATTIGHALGAPFSHDEHQFVASGALISQGLLPYRDFPLHHLPYLAALYALPSVLTARVFLASRILSAVFSASTLLLLFLLARKIWQPKVGEWAPLVGLATSMAVAASPLFSYTSGRAWNHDLSVFLMLVALAILLNGDERAGSKLGWTGFTIGLAIGTRLTALLTLLPLLLFVASSANLDFRLAAARAWKFLLGLVVSLVPVGVLFLVAPTRFYYGNWVYHRLNTAYRRLLSHDEAMSLVGKGRYFIENVVVEPAHLILLFGFALLIALAFLRKRNPFAFSSRSNLLFLISIFLFMGSLLPTPAWLQYFYAPLPFFVLALSSALAERVPFSSKSAQWSTGILLASMVMVFLRGGFINDWEALIRPTESTVSRVNEISERIKQELSGGRVVTLAPIFPLEAGLSIEPALAAGPFTYRVAPLLEEPKRRKFGLLSPDDLVRELWANPPAALLTGTEADNIGFASDPAGDIETPLIDFAQSAGYKAITIPNDLFAQPLTLWLVNR